jgi:hypothetical protein
MRYIDFDSEFPRRCLGLLGKRPFAEDGNACTKLLAIAGTLLSATADRQFALNTQVHVATGESRYRHDAITAFVNAKLRVKLPALRNELVKRYAGAPPMHWCWDPLSFELKDQRAGDPHLFQRILGSGKPAFESNAKNQFLQMHETLRYCRNALAHGNVWLMAGEDFPASDPRAAAGDRIVGFALATTTPRYEERDPGGRPSVQTLDTPFLIKGLMISPFDFRAIVEGWAVLLWESGVSRGEGGRLISEDSGK